MKNIVYEQGAFYYVAKILGDQLKITRHCRAGGLAPWGSIFSRTYKVTANITAYNMLKSFAKGDAA